MDIYRLLESEVVPRYYDRTKAGLPGAWVDLMRRSMGSTIWRFSTTRMLQEYTEKLYLPAAGVAAAKPEAPIPMVTEAG
jgi:starch phosphorylase